MSPRPRRRRPPRGGAEAAGEAVDFAAAAAVERVARSELDVLPVAVEEGVHRVLGKHVVVLGRVSYARGMCGVRRRRGRRSKTRFNASSDTAP